MILVIHKIIIQCLNVNKHVIQIIMFYQMVHAQKMMEQIHIVLET